jgi:hypothetical protein
LAHTFHNWMTDHVAKLLRRDEPVSILVEHFALLVYFNEVSIPYE